MREKILWNPQIKKYYTVQREDASQIKPELKVEKEKLKRLNLTGKVYG